MASNMDDIDKKTEKKDIDDVTIKAGNKELAEEREREKKVDSAASSMASMEDKDEIQHNDDKADGNEMLKQERLKNLKKDIIHNILGCVRNLGLPQLEDDVFKMFNANSYDEVRRAFEKKMKIDD